MARIGPASRGGQRQARIMDAGQLTVSGPSGHAVPVSLWLRLPLRRLRTDDTLRSFANGSVAQHPELYINGLSFG